MLHADNETNKRKWRQYVREYFYDLQAERNRITSGNENRSFERNKRWDSRARKWAHWKECLGMETLFVARTPLQSKVLFKIRTFGFSHKTRIQNVIFQSKCSSKRLCCGQSCLVLFHLLLADRCPKLSQILTLELKKLVASPQVPDT